MLEKKNIIPILMPYITDDHIAVFEENFIYAQRHKTQSFYDCILKFKSRDND